MNNRSKLWLSTAAVITLAFILTALFLPHSFRLTAFSDIVQSLLLASGAAAFLSLSLRSQGRVRLFWSLITLGVVFWLAYQLFWTYNEVLLRTDVPDLCAWDGVLFLHMVPMMAAIGLRPQVPRDEYSARVGRLDFALLLVWWIYLYVMIVMPWQYVVPDIPAYNRDLNSVYIAEKIVLLAGLFASWLASRGEWRKIYAWLFAMNFCYSAGSTLANSAIAQRTYYSGSLYDIPLVVSMASLTWIGIRSKAQEPDSTSPEASTVYGVWVARFSMIAVFSLPLFAAYVISDPRIPPKVRIFRLALTLIAAFFLGVMVLVRQQMLDRELVRLLNHSRDSFKNLKHLQAQILQSEKLASIGQLVGGAAHELNNPITAMLGYSDLLLNSDLTPAQQSLAAKIGQQVRRTKSLVASLISFARQVPASKSALDLNTLARTAVKLTEPHWKALDIEVRTQLDSSLPKVLGDSNQLLQVCLQLLANCLHVSGEQGARFLTLSTEKMDGICVLQLTTEALPALANEPLSPILGSEDGLGLSACQGILQEHRGRMHLERGSDGGLQVRVELPATENAPNTSKHSTVPVMWQSQPFA